ncbi:MAG: Ig-like domain-containing protein [Lachnospiraceae bacterium]|nr:Ig-like domain-containing protein [Lachnospiraceae bacterium]
MRKLGKVSKRFLAFFLAASLAMPMSNYFMPIAYAEEYNDQGESTVKDVTTEVTEEVVTTSEEVTSEEVTSEEASGEDTSEDKTSEDKTSEDETSEDKTSEDETTQQKTTEDKADKATDESDILTLDNVIDDYMYGDISVGSDYYEDSFIPLSDSGTFSYLKIDDSLTLSDCYVFRIFVTNGAMVRFYLNGTDHYYVCKEDDKSNVVKQNIDEFTLLESSPDNEEIYYIIVDNASDVEYKVNSPSLEDLINNNYFYELDCSKDCTDDFNTAVPYDKRIITALQLSGVKGTDEPEVDEIVYGATIAKITVPADGLYQFSVLTNSEASCTSLYTVDSENTIFKNTNGVAILDNRGKEESIFYVLSTNPEIQYTYYLNKVDSLKNYLPNAIEVEAGNTIDIVDSNIVLKGQVKNREWNEETYEDTYYIGEQFVRGNLYKITVKPNETIAFSQNLFFIDLNGEDVVLDKSYDYNSYTNNGDEDVVLYVWWDYDPYVSSLSVDVVPDHIDVSNAEVLENDTYFSYSNTQDFKDVYSYKSEYSYLVIGKLFKIPAGNTVYIDRSSYERLHVFDSEGKPIEYNGTQGYLNASSDTYIIVEPQGYNYDWYMDISFVKSITMSGLYNGDFPDIVESATEISGDYECTELDCNVLLDISEIRNFHGNSYVQANLYKVKVPAGKMMDISSVNDSNNLVYGKYPDYSVIDTTGQTYNMLDAVSSIIVDNTNGDDMWYYFACLADWYNQYGTISCKVLNDFSGEKQKIEAVDGIYSIHIEDFENQKSDYFFDGRAQSGILYELEIPANTTVLNVTEPTCVYSAVAMEESANDFNYIKYLVYANQGNEIKKLCLFVTYVEDNSMDITLKQERNVYSYFDNALLIDDNYTTSLVVDENLSNYAKSFVGSLSAEGLLFKLEGGYIYDVTTYKMEYSDSITELQIYNEDGTPYDDIKLGVSPSPCGTNATGIKVPEGSFVYVWAGINPYCGPQSTSELISFERKVFVEAESLEVYYQGKKVEDTLHFSQGEGIVQFTVKTVPENAYVQYFACYTEDQSVIVTRDDGSCKLNGAGETDIVFEESFSGLSTSIHVVVDELKFIDEMVDEATPLESGTYTFTEDQYTKYYQDRKIDGEVVEGPVIGKGKLYKLVLPAGYKANITTDSVQFLEFQNVANKTVDIGFVGAYLAKNSTEEEKVYYLWASAAPGEHESLSFTVAIEPKEKIIPLQSIAFNGVPNPVTLDIGKTYSDAASKIKKTPADTTAEVVIEWTSSNPKIAKVDTKGKVTAVAPGNATITAKVKGDTKLASFNVKVNPKLVTSVALDKKTASVIEGDSIKLVAKVSPANATNKKVTWKSSNTKVAKVDANGKITAVAPGTADITVTSADGSKKSATCKITVTKKQAPKVDVSYSTHIQSFGWEKVYKKNGALSGTTGLGKRLEAIKIKVSGNKNLGIQYTTHCQSYGWLTWSSNDEISGTSSEGKRLEAIMIQLTGKDKDKYDVYYRVHAQSYGWLAWAKNGEASGTAGFGKRLEAIQIAVVRKGDAFDKNMGGIKSSNSKAYVTGSSAEKKPVVKGSSVPHVTYQSHVQSYGWQKWVSDGVMSGTSGESKRLEGMRIKITNCDYSGDIVYDTHVQSYGWLGKGDNTSTWSKNGAMSGTTGKGKRLEAIRIKLTGEMAKHYDVYYRVHAQSYGWLAWAKNGEKSGTAGYSKRLEGIQIVLVKKGDKAPSKNYGGITSKQNKAFIKK